jgi:sporulation protein YlmC with PRC-barrel domain
MLIAGSALKGYAVETSDGPIGTVKDVLFDDSVWRVRWLAVDAGGWLFGRQVLVHASALGRPDHEARSLPVTMTKAQVEASPSVMQDQPVTMQMESRLYDYYGWEPYRSSDFLGMGMVGGAMPPMPRFGDPDVLQADRLEPGSGGDPHLRSLKALHGYRIHASDGFIGHLENLLLDDAGWAVRYLVVDTGSWWFGSHVLISPRAVHDIDWSGRQVRLDVSQEKVKASPPWDPEKIVERAYERRLNDHYGWPGYGGL